MTDTDGTQDSSGKSFTRSLYEWLIHLYDFPYRVRIRCDDDLSVGSKIAIVVAPYSQLRDLAGRSKPDKYKEGYEVPACLVRESLSNRNGMRLRVALSILRETLALDQKNGIGYLTFLHLMFWDLVVPKEYRTVWTGPAWGQIPESLRYGLLRATLRRPISSLDEILSNWEKFGGLFATGFKIPPTQDIGVLDCLTLPPLLDEADDWPSARKTTAEVTIRVDARYAGFARAMADACKEQSRLGGSIALSLSTPQIGAGSGEGNKPTHAFIRQRDIWTIVYEGVPLPLIPADLKGFDCIAYLLERKGMNVPILELTTFLDPPVTSDLAAGFDAESEGLAEIGLLDEQEEVTDTKTIQDLKRRLTEIRGEEQALGKLGPATRLDELRAERLQISKYIAAVTTPAGRIRRKSDVDRARPRISRLVGRAYDRLGEYSESLYSHLRTHIHIGRICRYTPDRDIDWETTPRSKI